MLYVRDIQLAFSKILLYLFALSYVYMDHKYYTSRIPQGIAFTFLPCSSEYICTYMYMYMYTYISMVGFTMSDNLHCSLCVTHE